MIISEIYFDNEFVFLFLIKTELFLLKRFFLVILLIIYREKKDKVYKNVSKTQVH